jgi:hypothetical protein
MLKARIRPISMKYNDLSRKGNLEFLAKLTRAARRKLGIWKEDRTVILIVIKTT